MYINTNSEGRDKNETINYESDFLISIGKDVGEQLLKEILKKTKAPQDKIRSIVGTGYGRVSLPFIDKKGKEITCHGKGA